MTHWIWQEPEWPKFNWDINRLQLSLSRARLLQGKLLGLCSGFTEAPIEEINYQALCDDTLKTSEIEGEILDRDSVRSSVARHLGLPTAGISAPPSQYIDGMVEILLDATQKHEEPLTLERLLGWHAALFPSGYSGLHKIKAGELRPGVVYVISGPYGREKIHYEAPPAKTLKKELMHFLSWFNQPPKTLDGILRAGIAHFWFVILHPFEDGNGRLTRAITDMALAQDENIRVRLYSFSSEIMQQRKHYYDVLGKSKTLDITEWLVWFVECYSAAIEVSLAKIDVIIQKTKFWQTHKTTDINARQRKVLNRLIEAKSDASGITTRKYANLTKVSRATAYRELADLVEKKCLIAVKGKGRSSSYKVKW